MARSSKPAGTARLRPLLRVLLPSLRQFRRLARRSSPRAPSRCRPPFSLHDDARRARHSLGYSPSSLFSPSVKRVGSSFCMVTSPRGSVIASDTNTALNFPRNFAPLPLSRQSCGKLNPSVPSEAPENCQRPGHTNPARTTSGKLERHWRTEWQGVSVHIARHRIRVAVGSLAARVHKGSPGSTG